MWKFKDLYDNVQKKLLDKSADKWQDPSRMLNWYVFSDLHIGTFANESEPGMNYERLKETIEHCEKIANEIAGERNYLNPISEGPVEPIYASCDKCDHTNTLFYDTRVYDSCPRCKQLRMEPDEFLKESDMIL